MNDEYLIYGETLTAIADSIRSVSSESTTWTPDEMAAYILANLVKPTTRQAAKTYTPGTSNQTIPAGTFLTGAATIAGDSDLAVGNIKKGVNIFGKTGTLTGAWGDASKFAGITKVNSGSFTLTSSSIYNAYTVTHGLGISPKLYGVLLGDGTLSLPSNTAGPYGFFGEIHMVLSSSSFLGFTFARKKTSVASSQSNMFYGFQHGQTSYTACVSTDTMHITANTTTLVISPYTSSTSTTPRYLFETVPYYWIALA